MSSLEDRLHLLERRVRRLTTTAATLALLLVGFVCVAASRDQDATVVRAQRFEVVHDGKIMGILEATPVGGRLRVLNKTSTMTTEIGQDVADEGTFMLYRAGREQPAVQMNSDGVSLWRNKRSFVALSCNDHGGVITITNKAREDVAIMQADEKGVGEVSVFGDKGLVRKLTTRRR